MSRVQRRRGAALLLLVAAGGCVNMGSPIPALAVDPIAGLPPGGKEVRSGGKSLLAISEYDVHAWMQDALKSEESKTLKDGTLVLEYGFFSMTCTVQGKAMDLPACAKEGK